MGRAIAACEHVRRCTSTARSSACRSSGSCCFMQTRAVHAATRTAPPFGRSVNRRSVALSALLGRVANRAAHVWDLNLDAAHRTRHMRRWAAAAGHRHHHVGCKSWFPDPHHRLRQVGARPTEPFRCFCFTGLRCMGGSANSGLETSRPRASMPTTTRVLARSPLVRSSSGRT